MYVNLCIYVFFEFVVTDSAFSDAKRDFMFFCSRMLGLRADVSRMRHGCVTDVSRKRHGSVTDVSRKGGWGRFCFKMSARPQNAFIIQKYS